jgi:hypothetical protein
MISAGSVDSLFEEIVRTGYPDTSPQEPRYVIFVEHSIDSDITTCKDHQEDIIHPRLLLCPHLDTQLLD